MRLVDGLDLKLAPLRRGSSALRLRETGDERDRRRGEAGVDVGRAEKRGTSGARGRRGVDVGGPRVGAIFGNKSRRGGMILGPRGECHSLVD